MTLSLEVVMKTIVLLIGVIVGSMVFTLGIKAAVLKAISIQSGYLQSGELTVTMFILMLGGGLMVFVCAGGLHYGLTHIEEYDSNLR